MPAARPVVSTLTENEPGVDPLAGLTMSQDPPEVVVAAAVRACAEVSLAAMASVCAGAVPPTVATLKLRAVGVAAMVGNTGGGALVTSKLTLMVWGLFVAPVEATVTVPV